MPAFSGTALAGLWWAATTDAVISFTSCSVALRRNTIRRNVHACIKSTLLPIYDQNRDIGNACASHAKPEKKLIPLTVSALDIYYFSSGDFQSPTDVIGFQPITLNPAMRTLVAVLIATVLILSTPTAHATTLQEFNAKTDAEQSACVVNFIDKMTTDMRTKNPQLAQDIRTWFAVKAPGKPTSEGMERL